MPTTKEPDGPSYIYIQLFVCISLAPCSGEDTHVILPFESNSIFELGSFKPEPDPCPAPRFLSFSEQVASVSSFLPTSTRTCAELWCSGTPLYDEDFSNFSGVQSDAALKCLSHDARQRASNRAPVQLRLFNPTEDPLWPQSLAHE